MIKSLAIAFSLFFSAALAAEKTSQEIYDSYLDCLSAASDLSIFLDHPAGNSQTKVVDKDGNEIVVDKFFVFHRTKTVDPLFQLGTESTAGQLDQKTKKIVTVPVRGILVVDGDGFLMGRRFLEEDLDKIQKDLEKFKYKVENNDEFKEVLKRWKLLPVNNKKYLQELESTLAKNLDLMAKTLAADISSGKYTVSDGDLIKTMYGKLQDVCSSKNGVSEKINKKIFVTYNEVIFPKLKQKYPSHKGTKLVPVTQ